jgi:membrane-associated PAP2 superfamily phosphatase
MNSETPDNSIGLHHPAQTDIQKSVCEVNDVTYHPLSQFTWMKYGIFFIVLGLMSLILRNTNIDIMVSSLFYSFPLRDWPLCDTGFWNFVDHFAVYLTWGVVICLMLVGIYAPYLENRMWAVRSLILTLLVLGFGSGFIIDCVMKPYYKRSRPREITQFNGRETYTPVLELGVSKVKNSSFPSGHASVGFLMIAPAFAFRRHLHLARALLMLGIMWGSFVGFSRIIQGGHFLSDVVWSLGIILTLTCLFDLMLRKFIEANSLLEFIVFKRGVRDNMPESLEKTSTSVHQINVVHRNHARAA